MAEGKYLVPAVFFKKIVCEYNCRIELSHPIILQNFDSLRQAAEFFNKHPEYFVVLENDDGIPETVIARIRGMALCIPYATYRRGYNCLDPLCPRIHICREYVSGYCRNGMNCDRSHTFNTDSNRMALKRLNLPATDPPYPEEKLLEMLRVCSPQVCGWYNHLPHCRNGTGCSRFHICKAFVADRCVDPACSKAHDLNSRHSRRLLKAYDLEGKTLLEVKDQLLIHKVMPKDYNDRVNLQRVRLLNMWRLGQTPVGEDLLEERSTTKDTQIKLEPYEILHKQGEIEEIQNALGEIDLSEFLAYQQIVDSQEVFNEIRQTTTTDGKDTRQTYLCGSFVSGHCDDAKCPDVHFSNHFLWQVQVDGQWYSFYNINDDLEQACNRKDRNFCTQVPFDAHKEAEQPLLIELHREPKGVILHDNTKVKIRRLQVRPQASQSERAMQQVRSEASQSERAMQQVRPQASQSERAMQQVRPQASQSERAIQQAISWQILKDDAWLTLEHAGEEIEKAFQNKENEYITELPTNDSEAELIAINFESSTAVSLVTGIEHNIKRIVGDGLMEKEGSHGQDSEPEEVPQADDVGVEVHTRSEDEDSDDDEANPQQWQWQWRNEELKWVPFHKVISRTLEEQYMKRKENVRLRVNDEVWQVDYLALTQTNIENDKEYHIRRVNKI